MDSLKTGAGPLFGDPNPDAARSAFRQHSRTLINKVTTVGDAIARLLQDGDYLAIGGFGVHALTAPFTKAENRIAARRAHGHTRFSNSQRREPHGRDRLAADARISSGLSRRHIAAGGGSVR